MVWGRRERDINHMRYFFLSLFIYLDRVRDRVSEEGAEREEEERESQAGSAPSAQSPMWDSNS